MSRSTFLRAIAALSCLVLIAPSFATADEPKVGGAEKAAGPGDENLDVQLAKARLDLAKVELQRVLKANERFAGTYSESTVELLRSNVDIAQARLEASSGAGVADLHAAHLRELENELKIAELRWETAVRLNKSVPNSIDAQQVESRRLRVEVARLALARARQPARVATPMDHMQWQLERLQQELLDLTVRVDELSHRN